MLALAPGKITPDIYIEFGCVWTESPANPAPDALLNADENAQHCIDLLLAGLLEAAARVGVGSLKPFLPIVVKAACTTIGETQACR